MFLFHQVQQYLEKFLIENKQKILDDLSHAIEMEDVIASSTPPLKRIPEELHLIIDILRDFQSFFPQERISPTPSPIPVSNLDWCTPKLKVLVDILLEHHSPSFQGIVFVEQRHDASTLSKVLNLIPELHGKIRSAFLVGQGVNSDGVSTQTDFYDGDPIKLFRDRILNIRKQIGLTLIDGIHHEIFQLLQHRLQKKASTFPWVHNLE
jgi:endoribonuclease Dicer